jgi:hypothetical protein
MSSGGEAGEAGVWDGGRIDEGEILSLAPWTNSFLNISMMHRDGGVPEVNHAEQLETMRLFPQKM